MAKDDDEDKKELERWVSSGAEAAITNEKHPCFNETQGVKPRMLRFTFQDHTHLMLPYAKIVSMRYDASKGILIDFGTTQVLIRGRGLDYLSVCLAVGTINQVMARPTGDDFEEHLETEVVTDIIENPENY